MNEIEIKCQNDVRDYARTYSQTVVWYCHWWQKKGTARRSYIKYRELCIHYKHKMKMACIWVLIYYSNLYPWYDSICFHHTKSAHSRGHKFREFMIFYETRALFSGQTIETNRKTFEWEHGVCIIIHQWFKHTLRSLMKKFHVNMCAVFGLSKIHEYEKCVVYGRWFDFNIKELGLNCRCLFKAKRVGK